jgi:peptidoglycan/LPS O-acetylase OafA/YrhL
MADLHFNRIVLSGKGNDQTLVRTNATHKQVLTNHYHKGGSNMKGVRRIALFGSIAIIAGALLPAIVLRLFEGNDPHAEYQGSGYIPGVLGFIILAAVLLTKGKPGKRYSIVLGIVSLLAMLFMFAILNTLLADEHTFEGAGVFVSCMGCLVSMISSFRKMSQDDESSQPTIAETPAI